MDERFPGTMLTWNHIILILMIILFLVNIGHVTSQLLAYETAGRVVMDDLCKNEFGEEFDYVDHDGPVVQCSRNNELSIRKVDLIK